MKCSFQIFDIKDLDKDIKVFISKIDSKITSDEFIKYIAIHYLGIKQKDLIIDRNEYGKPFLLKYADIHYNISHTKGIIICAISNEHVGVDVERVKTFNRRIPKKFFTNNEQSYILNRCDGQERRFFEIWTRKEAYVKYLGKGLAISLDSFDVIDEDRILTTYIEDYIVSICVNSISNEARFKIYNVILKL